MHLTLTPAAPANRINPDEMRRLRATVATTLIDCPRTAIQAAVTTAKVALGEDWSQEGHALTNEYGLRADCQPLMRAVR